MTNSFLSFEYVELLILKKVCLKNQTDTVTAMHHLDCDSSRVSLRGRVNNFEDFMTEAALTTKPPVSLSRSSAMDCLGAFEILANWGYSESVPSFAPCLRFF
ncbi:hypothetical protein EVAR_7550_1 [Eumeta japonica]|uniref:Uncharacterized protein n=1 Tax=Eumeta variegata TaxID=151549 RepID=A0A4C1VPG0_EUMVA|nr:hypothetical protein EVAR_7550_1 [Eumeta japonica]